MSIVGISDNWQSLLAGLDIEQILRKKKGDEIIPEAGADLLNARDSLAAEIAAERHNVGAGNGSNPLDRNFVRQDREESRYVSATLKGFKAEREMDQARQNSTTALLEEFGGVNVSGTYFRGEGHSENWYKQRLKQKGAQELMEDAAERTRRERKEDQARTEEALTAPKDAEGTPAYLPGALETAAMPAPAGGVASEVASDISAPDTELPAAASAPAAVPSEDAALATANKPAVKAAASVNITV